MMNLDFKPGELVEAAYDAKSITGITIRKGRLGVIAAVVVSSGYVLVRNRDGTESNGCVWPVTCIKRSPVTVMDEKGDKFTCDPTALTPVPPPGVRLGDVAVGTKIRLADGEIGPVYLVCEKGMIVSLQHFTVASFTDCRLTNDSRVFPCT
jgi:hypothetical protein